MSRRFHLPSGAVAELGGAERPPALVGLFAMELARVKLGLTNAGAALGLTELPLSDFHTLRSILRAVGTLPEEEVELECENCGCSWRARLCSALELGPYLDGELTDPELDAPFCFEDAHALVRVDQHGTERQSSVRLRPLTLGEAQPLHLSLGRGRRPRWTPRVVASMGLVSIDEEDDPRALAVRLRQSDTGFLEQLEHLFEIAHYPPRLTVGHACPRCRVLQWVDLPALREFTLHALPREVRASEQCAPGSTSPFLSLDEFETLVRDTADPLFSAHGVPDLDLLVQDGPADCDDGGEPLLGAYDPPDPDALPPRPAEIRLYYRTFLNLHREQGLYDVSAEVDETLRHELEHHFGYLAGADPLDESEHAEIASEYRRRVGHRETSRRLAGELAADFADFLRRTWWLWVLVLVITILLTAAQD